MKFRSIFDATLGRLLLPNRAALASPLASEQWIVGQNIYVRDAAGLVTMRLLTSADFNVANGVPQLGADGKIPAALVTAASGGGTGKTVGELWAWAGDPATPPTGALVADGTEYLREDYPLLAAICGSRYGRARDDLYFRVPNTVGRAVIGGLSGPAVRKGGIYKVTVNLRGRSLTPGTYDFTFEGGTYTIAALGRLIVETETVPGLGATGVAARIEIRSPGSYSTFGSATSGSGSNVGVKIPEGTLPVSAGVTYEIYGRPVDTAITAVRVTAHGSGYTTAPHVSISGGALTGATAFAIIDSTGKVRHVVVTNVGRGDPTGATISITGGSGVGAAAVIAVGSPFASAGDMFGEADHPLTIEELPAHTHPVPSEVGGGSDLASLTNTAGVDELLTGGATGATGGDQAIGLFQPSIGVTWVIQAE